MDQPLARGAYAQVGGSLYLNVQHDALDALPTFVGLPATATPLPHRPPLIVRDDTNDLWIHTFAPATLLRGDITAITGIAPDAVIATIGAALGALLHVGTLDTAAHLAGR